jgi:predicted transcriptional regulator
MVHIVDQLSLIDDKELQSKLLVCNWMSPPHFLIFNNQTMVEVMETMKNNKTELILINKKHKVLGIITNKMIYDFLLQGHSFTEPIEKIWFKVATTEDEDTPIFTIDIKETVIPVLKKDDKLIGSIIKRNY